MLRLTFLPSSFLLFGSSPHHAAHRRERPLERGELRRELLPRLLVELEHARADLHRLHLLLCGLRERRELRRVLLRLQNAQEVRAAHPHDALRHEGPQHRQAFLADAVRALALPTVVLEQLQPRVHHLQPLRGARAQTQRVHHRVHVEEDLRVRDPTDWGTWWFSERE